MNRKPISRKWIFLLIIAVITVSACNLFSNLLNPVDDVVSEIEDIAEQVDFDDIEELQENIETMVPDLPTDLGDLGDIQATMEAVQDGFDMGEAPPDIPIIDGETEDFFASEFFISYTTPMNFDDVLAFYQEEMPNNDWEPNDEISFNMSSTAMLQFSKPNRIAIVTINENQEDETTTVLITLQPE